MYRILLIGVLLFFVALSIYFFFAGWPYYSLSLLERPHSSLHNSFKPSGFVGHGIGILAGVLAIAVFLYTLRKNWRRFRGIGKINNWFQFHIFMGISATLLVTIHTAFKFHGLLAVASYVCMVTVAASGFLGLFLYTLINLAVPSRSLTRESLSEEAEKIKQTLQQKYSFNEADGERLLNGFRSKVNVTSFEFLTLLGWMRNDIENIFRTF